MKPRGYAPVGTEDDSALQDGVALRLLAKYCPTLMDDEDQQLMMDDATTVVSEASVPATALSEPLDDEPLFDDDSDEEAAPKERPRLFASVPSARVPMLRRPPTCVVSPSVSLSLSLSLSLSVCVCVSLPPSSRAAASRPASRSRRYRDLGFLIAFAAHLAASAIVIALSGSFARTPETLRATAVLSSTGGATVLTLATVFSTLAAGACLALILMDRLRKQLIVVAHPLAIAATLCLCTLMLIGSQNRVGIAWAVVLLLCAAHYARWLRRVRDRTEFVAVMLEAAIEVRDRTRHRRARSDFSTQTPNAGL